MNRVVVVLFLLAFSSVRAYSQNDYLSVEKLFELGIANSLKVQSSKINVKIADSDVKDKRAERLPGVNIGLIGGYAGDPILFQKGLSDPEHYHAPNWSQNYHLELSQSIYQGGKQNYSVERADLQRQIAELNVVKDVSDVKLLLFGSYLNLFAYYKQKEAIETSIHEAQQRLHDIRGMEKQGMITSSDVLRSELQLSNYQLALTETINNITIVSVQLDVALGFDENRILVPDSRLLDEVYNLKSYDQYVKLAYNHYPELEISRFNTKIAEKNSQMIRSDYFPTLSVKGSNILSRPYNISQNLYANNWNISLSLTYNLSSLYGNRHKMNSAKQTVAVQTIAEQQIMQAIRTNLKTYYIKHQEALDRIQVLTKSVEQANENYRIVLNKYKNQIAILTDLLDASSLQLEAQLQLTTAKSDAVYTYYQLLNASGLL